MKTLTKINDIPKSVFLDAYASLWLGRSLSMAVCHTKSCRGPAVVLPWSCCGLVSWFYLLVGSVCNLGLPVFGVSLSVGYSTTMHWPIVCLGCSYCALAECLRGHPHLTCTFVLFLYSCDSCLPRRESFKHGITLLYCIEHSRKSSLGDCGGRKPNFSREVRRMSMGVQMSHFEVSLRFLGS